MGNETLVLLCNKVPWEYLRQLLTPRVKNVRIVRWSNEVPNLADFFISLIYAERIEITIYADPLLKTVDFPCPIPLLTRWFSYRRAPMKEFYFLYGKHVIGFDQGRFKYSKKWGKDPSTSNNYCYLPIEDPLVKDKDDFSFIEWSTIFT
ncbi:hypothetical protein FO519_002517 [Halicephalobus sp. NKZ332]|nr:hypothetical protein FO519_002517 [Halicephalobus sp. NKZ332]